MPLTTGFCPHFSVGLTGGIASGKSAVAALWAKAGARIVDTDLIAHQLTQTGGAALPAIAETFGHALMAADGCMDRSAMRSLAFASPTVRQRLEAILHPLIHEQALAQGAAPLLAHEHYVVFAVPLLVNLQGHADTWRGRVQRIAVVDCTTEQQLLRLAARSHLTGTAAQAILNAQASRAQRLACADDVIHNTGEISALPHQAAELHTKYIHLAYLHKYAPKDAALN